MTDLVLVPTPMERDVLVAVLEEEHQNRGTSEVRIHTIGFGPIAAAVRSASLMAEIRPTRVVLAGIAGTFDQQLAGIGTACLFDRVLCDGVGIGQGTDFQSAGALGWQQFGEENGQVKVGDELALSAWDDASFPRCDSLLTVCAASASKQDAQDRQSRYPRAVAEDMEGFSVAMACHLSGVPLQIVRGISNVVGNRKKEEWKIDQALRAAGQLAGRVLDTDWALSDAE